MAFPHTALQLSFQVTARALLLAICTRSLSILVPPLCVANVCSRQTDHCGDLHSIGITRLLRYPVSIPTPPVLCQAPTQGRLDILKSCHTQNLRTRRSAWPFPLSRCVARCRLRPRGGNRSSSVTLLFLLLAIFSNSISLPHCSGFSGLTTGFSV